MRTKRQTREELIANKIKFLRTQLDLLSSEIASLAGNIEKRYPNTASDLWEITFSVNLACESMEIREVPPLG